jgi:PleD family two-component response regulator
VEFAEKIRAGVGALKCKYEDQMLPPVTASIGVATTPPEERKMELEMLAEDRKRKAKKRGRNRVVIR